MQKIKEGFTLAEVLVALIIIGIIAAMTIPSLIFASEKTSYVTGLKKFVAIFQNGIKTYMVHRSCTDLACTQIFNSRTDNDAQNDILETALKSVFNIIKTCHEDDNSCQLNYNQLSGSDAGAFFANNYSYITADGMEINISDGNAGNCDSTGNASKMSPYCAFIYVDINGEKRPNVWGRDLFLFALGNNGILYPYFGVEFEKSFPGQDWSSTCGAPGSSDVTGMTGQGCAARVMEESWQMNY